MTLCFDWIWLSRLTRLAADAGSIPRCGKRFLSQSTFSAHSIMCAQTPTCSIACINICAHVKGHEIHVKSSMDYRNTKTPRKHRRLGSATLSQIAFPGENNPNLWREKSTWENTVVKKKIVNLKMCTYTVPLKTTQLKGKERKGIHHDASLCLCTMNVYEHYVYQYHSVRAGCHINHCAIGRR